MMPYTLNLHGRLTDLSSPQVMGILNVTPDSFYASSRMQTEQQLVERVRQIAAEGGTMIDVGACSTRPGSEPVSEQEEMERLRWALPIINRELTSLPSLPSPLSTLPSSFPISVDTFRPTVARMVVEEYGADIINDVSEGSDEMFRTVARLGVPYILMSVEPDLRQTLLVFARKIQQLRDHGQKDIILDPGFGFGKTLQQNFALLHDMEKLLVLDLPLLVGLSRKSMIYKTLGCTPIEALNGTTVLHTLALTKGASILRVHDVREAVECCRLTSHLLTCSYTSA
jgi:dihydropteroate synthase